MKNVKLKIRTFKIGNELVKVVHHLLEGHSTWKYANICYSNTKSRLARIHNPLIHYNGAQQRENMSLKRIETGWGE